MSLFRWILLAGFVFFILNAFYHVTLLLRRIHDDLSEPKGSISKGVAYSLTAAMIPNKKETAYLHMPTYAAGIIYHLGSFLAFAWLIPLFFGLKLPGLIKNVSIGLLLLSSLCGIAILLKRIVNSKLRNLSVPDDYFSNALVTGFQMLSAFVLLLNFLDTALFIYAAVLFFYIPVGKLRHIIYFIPARIYLGWFYGKRGVWPSRRAAV